jgi:dTDP-4-dehydrorhamnose 3,5-epimerase
VRFVATEIPGCWILEQERMEDERGYFARTWCARELGERGLDARLVQCSVSWNRERGTLRGMHYQAPPRAEVKMVRCSRGAIYDVAVDLRPDSPTFCRWVGAELTRDNGRALYIPRGFGHGFLTLRDDTEVSYQMSEFYGPAEARGVRWDDPLFGIRWPEPVRVIAPRDARYPDADAGRLRELCALQP